MRLLTSFPPLLPLLLLLLLLLLLHLLLALGRGTRRQIKNKRYQNEAKGTEQANERRKREEIGRRG